MALVFDSLAYMKRLEGAGLQREHAEAHAEAVREFVMLDLVTRTELAEALDKQTLRLTVRFGAMIAAAVGAIAALQKLL